MVPSLPIFYISDKNILRYLLRREKNNYIKRTEKLAGVEVVEEVVGGGEIGENGM